MKRLTTARRLRKSGKTHHAASPAAKPPPGKGSAPLPARPGHVRAAQQLLSEDADLPESYGETKIVLVPVHPFLVHVYWDLSPEHLKKILGPGRRRGGKGPRPTLRFYDTTASADPKDQARSGFDVDVELDAMNWYVHIWKPAPSYVVELGLRTSQGRFIPIARSNGARVPPASPSEKRDERYLLVRGDYEQVMPISSPPREPSSHAHGPEAPREDLSPDFSEPSGWFIGLGPEQVSNEGRDSSREGYAGTAHDIEHPLVQDISSPVPRTPQAARD